MTVKKLPFTFQLYKSYSLSQIHTFKDYIIHSEKSINSAQAELEAQYTQVEAITQEEDDSTSADYWSHEYYKIYEFFPSFFGQSTFIALYSFFEDRLRSLCDNIYRFKNYNIKVSHLAGDNYIEKSKNYLKIVVGLELDDLNSTWIKIKDYQKIRNCFVHENGNVFTEENKPLESQKYYNAVINNSDLEIDPNNSIKIRTKDFLIVFLDTIEGYLGNILDKLTLSL